MAKSKKRSHKGGHNKRQNINNTDDAPSTFQPLNIFFNRNNGYESIPVSQERGFLFVTFVFFFS